MTRRSMVGSRSIAIIEKNLSIFSCWCICLWMWRLIMHFILIVIWYYSNEFYIWNQIILKVYYMYFHFEMLPCTFHSLHEYNSKWSNALTKAVNLKTPSNFRIQECLLTEPMFHSNQSQVVNSCTYNIPLFVWRPLFSFTYLVIFWHL